MILFYLLVAIMPLVRHPLWSETSVAGLSLNKWLGLACLLLAVATCPSRFARLHLFRTVQSRLFVAFGLAVMLSFLVAGPSVPVEVSPFANWLSLLLLFFTAAVLVNTPQRLRRTLISAVLGVAFASLHLIREWQNYGAATSGARPGWVAGDPNYFALSALLCLPLSFLLAWQRGPSWQRVVCLSSGVVILFAFTLASSRGGLLGLATGCLVLACHLPRRVGVLTAGACGLAVLLLVTPTSPVLRLLEPSRSDTESTEVRIALLSAGVEMFRANPWTGIGVGNYKHAVASYSAEGPSLHHVAHNTYVELAAEMGVLGLVALVTILAASLRTFHRMHLHPVRADRSFRWAAACGLEAGLAGAAVAFFFLSALHARLMWLTVILSMLLPSLMGRYPAIGPRGSLRPLSLDSDDTPPLTHATPRTRQDRLSGHD